MTCHPLLSSCRLSGNAAVEVQALLSRPAMAYLHDHRIQVMMHLCAPCVPDVTNVDSVTRVHCTALHIDAYTRINPACKHDPNMSVCCRGAPLHRRPACLRWPAQPASCWAPQQTHSRHNSGHDKRSAVIAVAAAPGGRRQCSRHLQPGPPQRPGATAVGGSDCSAHDCAPYGPAGKHCSHGSGDSTTEQLRPAYRRQQQQQHSAGTGGTADCAAGC